MRPRRQSRSGLIGWYEAAPEARLAGVEKVMVSDDHGAYPKVADELGLEHQICRSHVKRNVAKVTNSIQEQLKETEPVPEGVQSSPERLQKDLARVQDLVRKRPEKAPQPTQRPVSSLPGGPLYPRGGITLTARMGVRSLVIMI